MEILLLNAIWISDILYIFFMAFGFCFALGIDTIQIISTGIDKQIVIDTSLYSNFKNGTILHQIFGKIERAGEDNLMTIGVDSILKKKKQQINIKQTGNKNKEKINSQ